MDWTQVEQQIVEDDRNKWDRKAAAEELRIAPDGFDGLNETWIGEGLLMPQDKNRHALDNEHPFSCRQTFGNVLNR